MSALAGKKGDFFRLFAAAFNAGLLDRESAGSEYLSADALSDVLMACDSALVQGGS